MFTPPQAHLQLLTSVYAVRIFFWTCNGKLDDLCGSDHYPISISYGSIETLSALPSWKLRKAEWPSFSNEASEVLGCCKPDISLDEFSEQLLTIAKNNIPKSKFSVLKHNSNIAKNIRHKLAVGM